MTLFTPGENHDKKEQIQEIDGTWGSVTAQELLDAAALKLQKIAEQ
jgi:hypothetical protein